MPPSGKEIEVKFYLPGFSGLESRLAGLGAQLVQSRIYERNLRFDTPGGELVRSSRVLRLRQDTIARLTYKGPAEVEGGASLRRELEFTVSDFEMAREFLEALGYQVVMMYEKYRMTYALDALLVTLDEMPYGNFMEIEGPSGESIQTAALQLELDWEKRILDGYVVLFERLRYNLGFTFRDLSFENFNGLNITPAELGL
jgi:adenylate cyclase class 2